MPGFPVINALSDLEHPCQAIADFMTLEERFGSVRGLKFAYVGDGNNVCHSLMLTAALLGAHCTVATPKGYAPKPEIVAQAREIGLQTGGALHLTQDVLGARLRRRCHLYRCVHQHGLRARGDQAGAYLQALSGE